MAIGSAGTWPLAAWLQKHLWMHDVLAVVMTPDAFDGGCVVLPGVGSLASLVLLIAALAIRRIRAPRDR